MNKIILTLEEEDILVLQEILLDNDNKAAMEFLKKCVAPKIPAKGTKDCDSSRCNPYLLKSSVFPMELLHF